MTMRVGVAESLCKRISIASQTNQLLENITIRARVAAQVKPKRTLIASYTINCTTTMLENMTIRVRQPQHKPDQPSACACSIMDSTGSPALALLLACVCKASPGCDKRVPAIAATTELGNVMQRRGNSFAQDSFKRESVKSWKMGAASSRSCTFSTKWARGLSPWPEQPSEESLLLLERGHRGERAVREVGLLDEADARALVGAEQRRGDGRGQEGSEHQRTEPGGRPQGQLLAAEAELQDVPEAILARALNEVAYGSRLQASEQCQHTFALNDPGGDSQHTEGEACSLILVQLRASLLTSLDNVHGAERGMAHAAADAADEEVEEHRVSIKHCWAAAAEVGARKPIYQVLLLRMCETVLRVYQKLSFGTAPDQRLNLKCACGQRKAKNDENGPAPPLHRRPVPGVRGSEERWHEELHLEAGSTRLE
eukprot:CAMPEP_0183435682 /NCGR_PEP_ID=MMETSP0370-20130417/68755_1 /TAXON_ID=268820 /ORGANISM="Peridinium aciculiferum, Strain PAER-2" /LENGTH=426 /DNA_ID=CAMNT_0025622861 /DNA_START=163 /DNA_END=1442 /DNA_ORIENTATION=+